jgi:hypothetical protein
MKDDRPDMCQYDYDLFSVMIEPLRWTSYNTTEEVIHIVGRSLLDINGSGRADGVRGFPQIRKNVVHTGDDYIEGM